MREYYETHKPLIQNILIVVLGTLCTFLFFRYLFPILMPFVCGWLLSLLFLPLVDGLSKIHVPRWIGSITAILLLLTFIGLLSFLLGSKVSVHFRSWYDAMPQYIIRFNHFSEDFWARADSLAIGFPAFIQNFFVHIRQEAASITLSIVQYLGSSSAITAVPKFLLGFVVALFSSYFFTKDNALVHRAYERYVSVLFGHTVGTAKQELRRSLWGYVKTQLIIMAIVFAICWLGMSVLRSPHALLLSICIAVIDALPFFGSGFILWPGAIICLVYGNTFLAIGYLVVYVVLQIVRQLLQPKILGSQIGLHPLLTLFSLYVGYRCLGFFGLIIGPIAAVILRGIITLRNKMHSD